MQMMVERMELASASVDLLATGKRCLARLEADRGHSAVTKSHGPVVAAEDSPCEARSKLAPYCADDSDGFLPSAVI